MKDFLQNYHYYMKINLKLLALPLLALFCFSYAQAQVTVVKQDGKKIYLDTSEYNRTVAVGDSFKVILSQEQLINPKTGKAYGIDFPVITIEDTVKVQKELVDFFSR